MERVDKSFRAILNRGGYGFQYRVVREAIRLDNSPWIYIAPEFPAGIQGYGTRVDFVLKHRHIPLYILAECKRANPRFSTWCFAHIPFPAREARKTVVFIEVVSRAKQRSGILRVIEPLEGVFDIAEEVKTDKRGDSVGGGRDAIEGAATQVCRGLNGFVDFCVNNPQAFGNEELVGFLPVIFTTAQLWTSDIDLSLADAESGVLPDNNSAIEPRPWLFYHYYQSPGLKHAIPPWQEATSLQKALYAEYIRTIPIVSASGIQSFLLYEYWRDTYWWRNTGVE